MIEPHGMPDDVRRKRVTLVQRVESTHAAIVVQPPLICQYRSKAAARPGSRQGTKAIPNGFRPAVSVRTSTGSLFLFFRSNTETLSAAPPEWAI